MADFNIFWNDNLSRSNTPTRPTLVPRFARGYFASFSAIYEGT